MKKKIIAILITLQLSLVSFSAYAQEITAINFLGEVIGKVLPDGKVIDLSNNIIGLINADSQIVNSQNDIVGGIVPQGIAIGNDFKVLGRPTENGKILSPSGGIIGSVLPNGLVIDDKFSIIGSVLFPGIVFSDTGEYVGRLSGDGYYTDITGKQIGFITPDGYAYRKVSDTYTLDGRLISSKMVLSLQGEPMGSLNPEGSLQGFDGKTIGQVRANGFVYNPQGKVVGKTIKTGYAFDNKGNPIGFITYNGKVVNKSDETGKVYYNDIIVDKDKKPIGFSLATTSTATDLKGNFLGIVSPSGGVINGSEQVGFITTKGIVLDRADNIIGKVIKTGPVFNYKSDAVAHALPNGSTYNINGAVNGYVKDSNAYDLNGKIFGKVYESSLVFTNDNDFLGLSSVNNKVLFGNQEITASNYGYAYNASGEINGQTVGLNFVYNQQGSLIGLINPLGYSQTLSGQKLGDILGSGFVVDELNKIIGKTFLPHYLNDDKSIQGLMLSDNNLAYSKGGSIEAKILPDTSVIATKLANTVELMPQISKAYEDIMVVSYDGELLGYVGYDNYLRDLKSTKIGSITNNGIAIDNASLPIGEVVSLGSAVDKDCKFIGVANLKSEVRSFRDVMLGKILANSFVLSENSITGYIAKTGSVVDNNGSIIGYSSSNAHVYNFSKEKLGCTNSQSLIKNDNITVGRLVQSASVINFDNIIVGRTVLDGSVVDASSKVIGYMQPNTTISSITGDTLGTLFEYRYAFDGNNKFIGLINEKAEVLDKDGKVIAKTLYDGSVVTQQNNLIGFALNDLYVYDNDNNPIGYIELSGNVKDFENNSLGLIKKGFLVDNKDVVIARGNRDYIIRNEQKIAIGHLSLNGDVKNEKSETVGTINKSGEVKNSAGNVIAIAKPLQYHNNINITPKRDVVVDENGNIIGYVDEYGNVYDNSNKKIGTRTKDGKVIDENGKVIGRVLASQDVYDENGNIIGTTRSDGTVVDENGKVIGRLNENGELVNANGDVIGGISKDWYQRIEALVAKKQNKKEETKTTIKDYLRAISIALTPDGAYLGDILEDNTVVDANGNRIGRREGSGLIVNDKGELIGVEEKNKTKEDVANVFIPDNYFGPGNPYGSGNGSGNLGAGGGYGPGERYDPVRVKALQQAQASVRQQAATGVIGSDYNPSSFNYTQDNWENADYTISSWKVNMSEMILADKPIPAVIARSIYSTSKEVPVTAYVERNVYSEEGRNIMIPAGSRLIGEVGGFGSTSGATTNAAKVDITWTRLIRPDGSAFDLKDSVTGDAQGRQGALGYVDQQLAKRYIAPALVTALTVAGTYFMAPDEESENDEPTPKQEAAEDARSEFTSAMNTMFQSVLNDNLDNEALIFVPAGTRIIVYPKKDLWLRNPVNDQLAAKLAIKGQRQLITDDENGATGDIGGTSKNNQTSAASGGNQVYYGNQNTAKPQGAGRAGLIGTGSPTPTNNSAIVIPPPLPPPSQGSAPTNTTSENSSDSEFNMF